jgi:hypothetical protein
MARRSMKAKKALKKLRRVEELLAIVIDEFVGNEPAVRELLNSARTSVMGAKAGINSQSAPRKAKKPQVKAAQQSKRPRLAAPRGKRIFPAGKERSELPRRFSERKSGSRVRPVGERGIAKGVLATSPITKPDDRLTPETSPEPLQVRHAN